MWLLGSVGRFFLIFSSEMWLDTYVVTDNRDLANAYPLCYCISPSIYQVQFTGLHILPLTLYKI